MQLVCLSLMHFKGSSAGTESILPMPPKCSEQKDEGVHGNTTTQVEVFHEHEQHDGNHTMFPNFSAYENGTRDQAINKGMQVLLLQVLIACSC